MRARAASTHTHLSRSSAELRRFLLFVPGTFHVGSRVSLSIGVVSAVLAGSLTAVAGAEVAVLIVGKVVFDFISGLWAGTGGGGTDGLISSLCFICSFSVALKEKINLNSFYGW